MRERAATVASCYVAVASHYAAVASCYAAKATSISNILTNVVWQYVYDRPIVAVMYFSRANQETQKARDTTVAVAGFSAAGSGKKP